MPGSRLGQRWGLERAKTPYSNNLEAKEIVDTKRRLNEIISKHTGQTAEKVERDSERNFYLSAEQAKAYGIIDEVIVRKK